jgi:hypothetical protein
MAAACSTLPLRAASDSILDGNCKKDAEFAETAEFAEKMILCVLSEFCDLSVPLSDGRLKRRPLPVTAPLPVNVGDTL